MFKYTAIAFRNFSTAFKKGKLTIGISLFIFTLAFCIYNLVMERGFFYITVALLSLCVMQSLFKILLRKKTTEKLKKALSHICKITTLALKTFTLAVTLYGIYVGTANADGISIILATLSIILWVLQVLLEIVMLVVVPKLELLWAGFLIDMKPIFKLHDTFSCKEDDFNIDYESYKDELDNLKQMRKDRKASIKAKKAKKKLEKKQAKNAAKAKKRAEKNKNKKQTK